MSDSEVPTTKPVAKKPFMEVLADAAKLTVFFVFIMYAMGFVIWTSYLGKYGFATSGLLQVEYISSAFCYLFLFSFLALPAVWVFMTRIQRKELNQSLHKRESFRLVGVLWTLVMLPAVSLYFPNEKVSSAMWLSLLVASLALCHSMMMIWIYKNKIKRIVEKGEQPYLSKRDAILTSNLWLGLYSFIIILIIVQYSPAMDKKYFIQTPIMFLALPLIFISRSDKETTRHLPLFNALIALFAFTALITNVQTFGARQFEAIPKWLGGGKPQRALLRLGANNQELAELLQLKHCSLDHINKVNATNGFYGPVQILMKTDKEIYFTIDEAISTNKHTARQIRSDLVEGMVFLN
jgi:hypothetical protein